MKADLKQIEKFLANAKIALVGASRNEKKFGSQVLKHLVEEGFEVLPVHPEANVLQGFNACKTISDLPNDVKAICLLTQKAIRIICCQKLCQQASQIFGFNSFQKHPKQSELPCLQKPILFWEGAFSCTPIQKAYIRFMNNSINCLANLPINLSWQDFPGSD